MTTSEFPEPQRPEAPRDADPTIGKLVSDALTEVSTLVRNEIALAKAEVTLDVKKAGVGGVLFGAAAFMAIFGLAFLLHALARGIAAAGLPVWAGYLIVAVLLFIVAAVAALIGLKTVKKIQGKPERTINAAVTTIDEVKRSTTGETTAAMRLHDPVEHGATGRAGTTA